MLDQTNGSDKSLLQAMLPKVTFQYFSALMVLKSSQSLDMVDISFQYIQSVPKFYLNWFARLLPWCCFGWKHWKFISGVPKAMRSYEWQSMFYHGGWKWIYWLFDCENTQDGFNPYQLQVGALVTPLMGVNKTQWNPFEDFFRTIYRGHL